MKHFVAGIHFFLISIVALGQNPSFNWQDLKSPTSPAFSILDFEPTSVMRPTSPSQLATNVLTAFDNNGNLVPNIGLEFQPYWLKSNPNLTWEEYHDPDIWQAIAQTLSVSAASVKDSGSAKTQLGFGFRFQPKTGGPSEAFNKKASEFFTTILIEQGISLAILRKGTLSNLEDVKKLILTTIDKQVSTDERKSFAKNEILNFNTGETDVSKILEELEKKYNTETLAEELSDLNAERIGWITEISGALSYNTNEMNQNGTIGKFGLWGTLTYKTEKQIEFIFLARYVLAQNDSLSTNFDMGLSYVKSSSKFQISLEAVYRHFEVEFDEININNEPITRVEKKDTYRIALNAQLSLNGLVSINFALGKDYDKPFVKEAQLFSILGLNFNLFKSPELN